MPQRVYPNTQSLVFDDIFVDSGTYPEGLYTKSAAFVSLRPDFTTLTGAFSSKGASARGTVRMWLPAYDFTTSSPTWEQVVIEHQLLAENASQTLWSTHAGRRVGVRHYIDERAMVLSNGTVVPFSPRPDGYFVMAVYSKEKPSDRFLPDYCGPAPQLRAVHRMWLQTTGSFVTAVAYPMNQSVPASVKLGSCPKLSAKEMHVWRMMGFPFDSQWKRAVSGSSGHGLGKNPTSVHMFTDLNVLAARMRALPFHKTSPPFRAQVVGGLIWMDFHEGLVTSTPHRFLYHCMVT